MHQHSAGAEAADKALPGVIDDEFLREMHGFEGLQGSVKSADVAGNMGISVYANLNPKFCASLGDPYTMLLVVSLPHKAVFVDLDGLVELFYPVKDSVHVKSNSRAAYVSDKVYLGILKDLEIHVCGPGYAGSLCEPL